MHELPLENVRPGIVQTKTLSKRGSGRLSTGDERDEKTKPQRHKVRFPVLLACMLRELFTLSQDETRRRSVWLEKRRLEMPSEGGSESSLPPVVGGRVAAVITAKIE
ncbi:hypothetical protein BHE74_00013926 [Ensete ventricosum]|nr:hypothetical protein BHE74_00013926 [Ensete ventricosum]